MTAMTHDGLPDERRDLLRWLFCGALILGAHAAVTLAFITWHEPEFEEGDLGTGVVMVELSPITPDVQSELPPGPEQVESTPTPDQPEQKTEEEVVPLPEQKSEVSVAPTPDPTPQPKPHEDAPPAPATTAPQAPRASAAVATWKTQIVKILERNKRYPAAARARGEHGVAQLAFSIDRQGHVIATRLVASSGSAALDEETLALVRRSAFPPVPADLPGTEIGFTVPVRFNIH